MFKGKSVVNRLGKIRFVGSRVQVNDVELRARAGASLSLSRDQVTQLSLTVQDDHRMTFWNSGVVQRGTTVTYDNRYSFEIRGWTLNPDDGSIQLTFRSKASARLKDQTGPKNWGKQSVSSWFTQRFREAGLKPIVQPGLGDRVFQRQMGQTKGQKQSTWDVMTSAKEELGVWLVEAGNYGILAKPKWLEGVQPAPVRKWSFWWNSNTDHSALLTSSPRYRYTADSSPADTLSFGFLSVDADQMKPGDIVHFSGGLREVTRANWIVTDVTIPLANSGPVDVSCMRVRNPTPVKTGL